MKPKRGISSRVTAGIVERGVVSAIAIAATTCGISTSSLAQDAMIYFGWDPKGKPFVFEDVPRRPRKERMKWSMTAWCDVPADSRYDMSIARKMKANGNRHSGVISGRDYERLKNGEINGLPKDLADVYGKGSHFPWPILSFSERLNEEMEAYRKACEVADQEQEEHKSKVAKEKERRIPIRQKEGLREAELFQAYCQERGGYCRTVGLNMVHNTVGLYCAPFPSNPNCIVAWYDEDLVSKLSSEKESYRRGCINFLKNVLDLHEAGNTVCVITDKEAHKIIWRLEDIAIRLQLPPMDYNTFLSELEKSRPYIFGPGKPKN